jgi:hypothetical protein
MRILMLYRRHQDRGQKGPSALSKGMGGKPKVFRSGLESAIGDVGKATHHRKMRKWKSLAKK